MSVLISMPYAAVLCALVGLGVFGFMVPAKGGEANQGGVPAIAADDVRTVAAKIDQFLGARWSAEKAVPALPADD